MGDRNTLHLGDGAQAKQVAQGQNISQTIIENYFERARLADACFSIPKPPPNFTGRADEIALPGNALTRRASLHFTNSIPSLPVRLATDAAKGLTVRIWD